MSLAGVRVIDLTRNIAGPYCTMMLADMGAEVIKVEHPDGDELRSLYKFDGRPTDAEDYFAMSNRNKRSVSLDVKTDAGAQSLRNLLRESQIFVQNLSPGAVDRLGFGFDAVHELNPALVYVSISGFGPDDPRLAYDGIVQAATGTMDITGPKDGPPVLCGLPIADLSSALFSAFATMNALRLAERTGEGVLVDVSMFDSVMALHGSGVVEYLVTGRYTGRLGSEYPHRVPSNSFKTADGRYVFVATNNATWAPFCKALDLDELVDDERFRDNQQRVRNRASLNELIADKIERLATTDVLARFEAHRVPHSRVDTCPEAIESDYSIRDQMVIDIAAAEGANSAPVRVMGFPYRLSTGQPRVRTGPPALGEANAEFLTHGDR